MTSIQGTKPIILVSASKKDFYMHCSQEIGFIFQIESFLSPFVNVEAKSVKKHLALRIQINRIDKM